MCLPLLFAACGDSGNGSKHGDAPPSKSAASTVMIYMVGADLESRYGQATGLIEQMLAASQSKDVNVVLATGGANKAVAGDLVDNWKVVRHYEIRDGKLNLIADLGSRNMVDPDTLSDFVVWAKNAYPAERYRLLLWDHGGGNYGFGQDENFPGPPMPIPKLAGALDAAHRATGIHFDLIGLDACEMGTTEIAHALAPYADYLAASEEAVQSPGWDYGTIVSGIAKAPAMDGAQFGKLIADSYLAMQKKDSDALQAKGALTRADAFITMSVVDLRRVGELTDAMKSFSTALSDYVKASPAQWLKVARERASTPTFGGVTSMTQFTDLVDLGTFADRLAAADIVAEQSRAVSSALRQAVVYRGNGPLAMNRSGLSIYFPSRYFGTQFIDEYAEFESPPEYLALLKTYVDHAIDAPSVISIDVSRSTPTVLNAVVASGFGIKDANMVVTQPTADPNIVSITMGHPVPVKAESSGDISVEMKPARLMLNGESVYIEQMASSEREVDGKTQKVVSYGIGAFVRGKFGVLVFEEVGDGDPVFVGIWDGVDEGTKVAPRTRNDLLPTDIVTLATIDFDLSKQEVVAVRPDGKSFAAGKMEISAGDFSSSMGSFRLMVSDFRDVSHMSDAVLAKF
jgi:hypothetical protein